MTGFNYLCFQSYNLYVFVIYLSLHFKVYIYIFFPILHLGYFSERKSPSYKSDAMIQLGGKRDIISTRRTILAS